jgi:hypothetical protein
LSRRVLAREKRGIKREMCLGNEITCVMVREREHNLVYKGIGIYTLKHVFNKGQSKGNYK